jgi:hypothetical protein
MGPAKSAYNMQVAFAPHGKVLLVHYAGNLTGYAQGYGHSYQLASTDDGATWSAPTDLATLGVDENCT